MVLKREVSIGDKSVYPTGRTVLAEARALHCRSERLRKQVEVALARAKELVAKLKDPTQS